MVHIQWNSGLLQAINKLIMIYCTLLIFLKKTKSKHKIPYFRKINRKVVFCKLFFYLNI